MQRERSSCSTFIFNLHFSIDIRPLPLWGLAPVSLKILLHSSSSFITKPLFCQPWLPLCPHPHLGRFGGKSTGPWFGWPCKVAEEQAQRRSRRCLLAQKISSSGKGLAKPAQCHLLFDPPPVSEAHSGGRPCQQQEDVEWTKEKPFQMVRTASTLGPV